MVSWWGKELIIESHHYTLYYQGSHSNTYNILKPKTALLSPLVVLLFEIIFKPLHNILSIAQARSLTYFNTTCPDTPPLTEALCLLTFIYTLGVKTSGQELKQALLKMM